MLVCQRTFNLPATTTQKDSKYPQEKPKMADFLRVQTHLDNQCEEKSATDKSISF